MTREANIRAIIECCFSQTDKDIRETAIKNIVESLQSENEFISSAEDYRLRLIQIFHNTHCEEFISFMVLPTESDLNMLEDMLREHYKDAEPCVDAISRQAVLDIDFNRIIHTTAKTAEMIRQKVEQLPSVTPKSETVTEFADRCRECGARYGKLLKRKTGHWILIGDNCMCSNCNDISPVLHNYCPNCGARMESEV